MNDNCHNETSPSLSNCSDAALTQLSTSICSAEAGLEPWRATWLTAGNPAAAARGSQERSTSALHNMKISRTGIRLDRGTVVAGLMT